MFPSRFVAFLLVASAALLCTSCDDDELPDHVLQPVTELIVDMVWDSDPAVNELDLALFRGTLPVAASFSREAFELVRLRNDAPDGVYTVAIVVDDVHNITNYRVSVKDDNRTRTYEGTLSLNNSANLLHDVISFVKEGNRYEMVE